MGNLTKTTEVADTLGIRQAYCNQCGRDTKHETLYSRTTKWEEDFSDEDEQGFSIDGGDIYSLVECRGCEAVRMMHEHWFSEDWDERGTALHCDYYPPNTLRKKPDWMNDLPREASELGELLDEVYRALAVDARRLATMGIRSLVEKVMIDKVGDAGTFVANIAKFFAEGYVAGFQQKMFQSILVEAGHAAMHRDWQPSSFDVTTLVDIIEQLIKATYIDPDRAEKVAKRIPPRPSKKKSDGSVTTARAAIEHPNGVAEGEASKPSGNN